jgi:Flp pilus assembly protein TadD
MKAGEAFPDDPALEKASGIVAYRSGDFSRAANLLQFGEHQLGDDPELAYYLGMAQYRLNMRIESRKSLQRALKLNVNPELAAEARRILAEPK